MEEFFAQARAIQNNRTFAGIYEQYGIYPSNHYSERLVNGRVERTSYAAYRARIQHTAAALRRALEGGPATIWAGLQMKNCPDWGCVFWAMLMCGLCPLLLDAGASPEQTAYLLEEAGAGLLIGEHDQGGVAFIQADSLPCDTGGEGFAPQWANEMAFASSGTTEQQICVYDGEAMTDQIVAAWDMPEFSPDIMYPNNKGTLKNLAMLPFHHIFGFVAVFMWFSFFGRTLVFIPDLAPATLLETCRKLKVSHIFGVPMLWNRIADQMRRMAADKTGKNAAVAQRLVDIAEARRSGRVPDRMVGGLVLRAIQKKLFGTHVRFMISGGSYISPETLYMIDALGYPLYNGYGLTEAGITSVMLEKDTPARLEGAVGRPLRGVEYRIRATGEDPDQGELMIRSSYLHKGVLKAGVYMPRQGGEWFATGDVARQKDGRYEIIGKLKDIIIGASGENIAPDELQAAFAQVPYAAVLCVLGLPGDGDYEQVGLIIQPEHLPAGEEELVAMKDAVNAANGALPLYKKVQAVYLAELDIPTTTTMKIQRGRLREQFVQMPRMFRRLNLDYTAVGESDLQASSETMEAVRKIFAEALHLTPKEVGDDAHFVFDLSGDSFAYAAVIAAVEEQFGFSVTPGQYTRCTTVRQLAALIDNRQHLIVW